MFVDGSPLTLDAEPMANSGAVAAAAMAADAVGADDAATANIAEVDGATDFEVIVFTLSADSAET